VFSLQPTKSGAIKGTATINSNGYNGGTPQIHLQGPVTKGAAAAKAVKSNVAKRNSFAAASLTKEKRAGEKRAATRSIESWPYFQNSAISAAIVSPCLSPALADGPLVSGRRGLAPMALLEALSGSITWVVAPALSSNSSCSPRE
jgi:hypothetical protein